MYSNITKKVTLTTKKCTFIIFILKIIVPSICCFIYIIRKHIHVQDIKNLVENTDTFIFITHFVQLLYKNIVIF